MFVRIIHRGEEQRGEALIQCDKVLIDLPAIKEGEKAEDRPIRLTLQSNRDMRDDHHEVKRKDTEVYIMNDEGKTIDKYIW